MVSGQWSGGGQATRIRRIYRAPIFFSRPRRGACWRNCLQVKRLHVAASGSATARLERLEPPSWNYPYVASPPPGAHFCRTTLLVGFATPPRSRFSRVLAASKLATALSPCCTALPPLRVQGLGNLHRRSLCMHNAQKSLGEKTAVTYLLTTTCGKTALCTLCSLFTDRE